MATIAIAQPSAAINALITSIIELRGDTAVACGAPAAPGHTYDGAVVEPAWDVGLAFVQRLRQLDPNLPVVCLSIRAPTPESRALAPVAHLPMPFSVAELNAALDAALGLTSSP